MEKKPGLIKIIIHIYAFTTFTASRMASLRKYYNKPATHPDGVTLVGYSISRNLLYSAYVILGFGVGLFGFSLDTNFGKETGGGGGEDVFLLSS